jgi:TPR repeat protein
MAKAKIKTLYQQAQQGDPQAQYQLGYLHTRGEGVPLDYSIAADYLDKAAARGQTDAQFLLGALFQQGKGVSADYKRAVDLYRAAAEKGHALAQFDLVGKVVSQSGRARRRRRQGRPRGAGQEPRLPGRRGSR